jgi:acyl-CoA thioesterase
MNFTDLLKSAREPSPVTVPAGWAQGRAAFGGLAAALLYESMAAEVDPQTPLRSLTVSFVAPVETGDLQAEAQVLRAGRSVTQVMGQSRQAGQVVTSALASYGNPRESAIAISPKAAPKFIAPDECQALPYIPGVVPEFTQHFDYRIAAGNLPFTDSTDAQLGGWVRFKNASGQVSISHLLALIDAWPPAVLSMLKQPAPASSLTWTIEIIEPLAELSGEEWWQYLAEVEQAGDGYAVIQAKLWDKHGRLAALSRQTVTVFG